MYNPIVDLFLFLRKAAGHLYINIDICVYTHTHLYIYIYIVVAVIVCLEEKKERMD